jgi:16S rRNA (cytosine967-C5)-methyltransferase
VPRPTLTSDARTLAHEVLVRVEATEAFADVLLGHRLAETTLPPADRSLATRLVFGTLAWQGRLDHHLGSLVRTPLTRLDPPVRVALRLGLYQLLFLERIPAYAAVDSSVRIVRREAGAGAAGLANAVLRRAAANVAGLALPDPRDPMERLAIEWSHPRWLVERWAADYGVEEMPRLLAANNEHGKTTLRVNTLRTTPDALGEALVAARVGVTPGRWSPDALVIDGGAARVRAMAAYREGHATFQGEASQLVTRLLGLTPGLRLLDACAAPGGKTAHAAAQLGATGLVAALDVRPGGVRRIAAEAARIGAVTVHVAVGDARRPPFAGPFDAVLVDAPCSGLGTLRRHPELRWRRRPEDVARLAALQQEILRGVAGLVRPGGVLVFSVCTLTREENEGAVEAFLAADPRFGVEPAGPHLPGAAAALVGPDGFLRTLPHRHDLDGFFAARLRARA